MNIDDFAKSPISALRAISEESHVRLSTLNSSKIAQALILDFLRSRLISTFYGFINIDGFVKKPMSAKIVRAWRLTFLQSPLKAAYYGAVNLPGFH